MPAAIETNLPPNPGIIRAAKRKRKELTGSLFRPKGRDFFLLWKFVILLTLFAKKYSSREAKLFPIQDVMIPTTGPKRAPFRIIMGSEGIGVMDKIPTKSIDKRGPLIPVFGI
jgi:hypothetical protein